MKDYEAMISRAVIKSAIKDIGGGNARNRITATKYILSPRFSTHCENAGYPPELLDTLKELSVLSRIQRYFSAREVIRTLNEYTNK